MKSLFSKVWKSYKISANILVTDIKDKLNYSINKSLFYNSAKEVKKQRENELIDSNQIYRKIYMVLRKTCSGLLFIIERYTFL